ncbi:MAG: hypothetical protein RLZZ161_1460 [Bacteroidota bacterium]
MANEQNPIDELFRNGLKDGGITPPPGVWEAVSAGLPATAPGLATVVFKSIWTWVAVGVISIGAAVSIFTSNEKGGPVQEGNSIHKNSEEKGYRTEQQQDQKSAKENLLVNPKKSVENPISETVAQPKAADDVSDQSIANAGENTSNKKPDQPTQETRPQKLVIEEHYSTADAPCGRSLKITSVRAGMENNWSFSLPVLPAAAYSSWSFGDGESGSGNTAQHTYADLNAEYEVKVLVFRSAGCIDSGVCRVVARQRHAGLSIPDVFTPNGDGVNDELIVTLPEVVSFNQVVTDRNGKQVFVSNHAALRWNGKCASSECPAGTYRVTITYRTTGGKQPVTYTKNVLLNR